MIVVNSYLYVLLLMDDCAVLKYGFFVIWFDSYLIQSVGLESTGQSLLLMLRLVLHTQTWDISNEICIDLIH